LHYNCIIAPKSFCVKQGLGPVDHSTPNENAANATATPRAKYTTRPAIAILFIMNSYLVKKLIVCED